MTDLKDYPITLLTLSQRRCNLRCEYCYVKRHLDDDKNQRFSDELCRDALALIKNRGISHVKLYGGEPLLEKEFCFSFIRAVRDSGVKADLFLGTNGILLASEDVQFLLDHDVMIVFSTDGFRAGHNARRRFKDNSPAGREIIKQFDMARRVCAQNHKPHLLGVSLVVAPDNNPVEMLKWFYREHIAHIGINILIKPDFTLQESRALLSHIAWALEEIDSDPDEIFRETMLKNLLRGMIDSYGNCFQNTPNCKANQAVVDSRGDIFFCGLVEFDTRYRIGSLGEGIDDARRAAILDVYSKAGQKFCAGCAIELFCRGACPEKLKIYSRNYTLKDNFYCQLIKLKFQWLSNLINKEEIWLKKMLNLNQDQLQKVLRVNGAALPSRTLQKRPAVLQGKSPIGRIRENAGCLAERAISK